MIVSLGGQTPLKLAGLIPRRAGGRHVAGFDRRRRGPRAVERALRRAGRSRSRPAAPRPTSNRRWRSPTRSASRCSCDRATCSAGGRCRSSTTATTSPGRWTSSPGSAASGKEGGLSAERPVLIDRFLADATEVDVDAIRDHTGEVLIGGVMEHVEEAGVHSGDSACAIPPQTLPAWVVEVIEAYTACDRRATRRARADQRPVRGRRHHRVRDRGQPTRQPDGAVRRQGDRRAARQGRHRG